MPDGSLDSNNNTWRLALYLQCKQTSNPFPQVQRAPHGQPQWGYDHLSHASILWLTLPLNQHTLKAAVTQLSEPQGLRWHTSFYLYNVLNPYCQLAQPRSSKLYCQLAQQLFPFNSNSTWAPHWTHQGHTCQHIKLKTARTMQLAATQHCNRQWMWLLHLAPASALQLWKIMLSDRQVSQSFWLHNSTTVLIALLFPVHFQKMRSYCLQVFQGNCMALLDFWRQSDDDFHWLNLHSLRMH